MKLSWKIYLASLVLVNLTFSPSSWSASDRNWSAGLLLGAGVVNNDFGTQPAAGLMIRDRVTPNFGIGFTVTSILLSTNTLGTTKVKENLTHINFDFLYYFTDRLEGLWVGPRLGWAYFSRTDESPSATITYDTKSVFDWGPVLGYDYRVSDLISLGGEVSYLVSNFDVSPFRALQIFGALKLNW